MNNQKVCISKQATFISVIMVMLIAYVFVAYRTMMNKTSTNSRASNTNTLPVPTLIPVLPPNCYDPTPKQRCLKPLFSRGINQFELTLTNEELQALKEEQIVEGYSNYAIMSVYKDMSANNETTPYFHTLLKVLPGTSLSALSSAMFVYDNSSNLLDTKNAHSFIIFGVPKESTPKTGQQVNLDFESCASARNYTVDLCTSVKSD